MQREGLRERLDAFLPRVPRLRPQIHRKTKAIMLRLVPPNARSDSAEYGCAALSPKGYNFACSVRESWNACSA